MKQAATSQNAELLNQIASIERDVLSLKRTVLRRLVPSGNGTASLKGIVKGVDVSDADILTAQKSLAKHTNF